MGAFDDLIPGYFQPDLAEGRTRFSKELDDPGIQLAFNQRIANEVGGQTEEEQQAFIESVLNRANARKQNLQDVVNDRSYFPSQSFRRTGDVDYSPLISRALLGSNVSKRATGNESGNVHSGGAPVTMAGRGGERFVVENPDMASVFSDLIPGKQSAGGAFDDLIPKKDTIPTYAPQVVTPPDEQAAPDAVDEEHDMLFYKTGKTKSEREALNKPLHEAMQVPLVSADPIKKALEAVGSIGATGPEDLQQGPVQQSINDEIARAISGMTTGEGAASLPLYAFPATAAGLTAENVQELPGQVGETAQKIKEGDYPGAAGAGTRAVLNALMTLGVLHGGAELMGPREVPSPLRPEPTLAERITQPRVEDANAQLNRILGTEGKVTEETLPSAPQEPLAPVTPETPPEKLPATEEKFNRETLKWEPKEDRDFWVDGLDFRQEIVNGLARLGVDVTKTDLPSPEHFTNGKDFFYAMREADAKMRQSGAKAAGFVFQDRGYTPPTGEAPPSTPVTEALPPPPIGTPLKPKPLIGEPGTTASDVAAKVAAPAEYTVQPHVIDPAQQRRAPGITVFDGPVDNPHGVLEASRLPTGELEINHAVVHPDLRGTGRGLGLFEKLIAEAGDAPIISDSSVSESAAGVFEGLGRRGYTVEKNPGAALVDVGLGEKQWMTQDKSPVFRITGRPTEAPVQAPGGVPGVAPELSSVVENLNREFEPAIKLSSGEIKTGGNHTDLKDQYGAGTSGFADKQGNFHTLLDVVRLIEARTGKMVTSDLPDISKIIETRPEPPPPTAGAAPPDYTPEAAAARAAQPATEPVGGNVAGFEKVYGPGEIPAGETLLPEEAFDKAQARLASGVAKPYSFVERAKTGAITPTEMGDLVAEHDRLINEAAAREGTPEYDGAYQAAKDFATNILKPAETAWHQKGMVMQIKAPIDYSRLTGFRQAMEKRIGREMTPTEAPAFQEAANDVAKAERVARESQRTSVERVRKHYAKTPDVAFEDAARSMHKQIEELTRPCIL